MNTQPFLTGTNQPLIKGGLFFYAVSGEALGAAEAVQVVVRLPYCLYVPSIRYLFKFPNESELVGAVPEKVWTQRSEGSTILNYERVVPSESVYLADSKVITDWVGQSEPFTGDLKAHNMEFDRDPNGYFRYTRLTLEFDWVIPIGYDPTQEKVNHEGIVDLLTAIALPVVNHFVDVYRYVTDDVYLARVPALVVEDIRVGIHDACSIRKHEKQPGGPYTYKYGYHPSMLGPHGIRPAVVSKPKEVVDSFQSLLMEGFRPSTDELLRQSALGALERHDVKLAVIESFISLEVYVERFYYENLSSTMAAAAIENLLSAGNNWRLVVRLKELLRNHFGKAIVDIDSETWTQWLKAHNERHQIIHRNLVPSDEDAQRILDLNESVKQAMNNL